MHGLRGRAACILIVTNKPPYHRQGGGKKNIHHHHHFVSIYVCFFGSPTSCDLEATWYNQSLPLFPAHSEAATLIAPPPIHQAPICLGVRLNKKGYFSHSKWLHMAKKDEFIRIGGGNWEDYLEKTRPEPDSFDSCKGEYLTHSRTINGDNQDLNLTPTESGFERLKWHLPVIWQRNQGWRGGGGIKPMTSCSGSFESGGCDTLMDEDFKRYAFVRMEMEHGDNSRQMR